MNELQKNYLLEQLALARELGMEFLPHSGTNVPLADLVKQLEMAAAPSIPARPAAAPAAKSGPAAATQPQPPAAPAPSPAKPAGNFLKGQNGLSRDEKRQRLAEFSQSIAGCVNCRLAQGRKQVVFGAGNPDADIVFIGEAPGFNEDQQGEPFVGAAGQLLDKIILAMQFRREDVYICNVIKCRPPDNRDPYGDEIEQCEPFLMRQLEIIEPRAIVCLGLHAARTLLRNVPGISVIRGKWQKFRGVPLMPTYHPAYLLRTPAAKAKVWDDMQQVMKMFGKDPKDTKKQR